MKTKMFKLESLNIDITILLLRLIFGGMFIYQGLTKLLSYNEILPYFEDIIGIGSELSLILVIFAEFFCGFLVTIGFLTRLTVIPIFITMFVAFFVAHANDEFVAKQLSFLFLLLSVLVFIAGSGKFSIDKLIFKK